MKSLPHASKLIAGVAASLLVQGAFAQDECSAPAAAVDGLNAFDTSAATASAEAWDCVTNSSPDIWFSYTPSADGDLLVSTCNDATYDTRLGVYEGTCGALTVLDCNDDGPGCAGFTSELTVAVTAGTPVLIRVGGFGTTSSGTGNLFVDGPVFPDDCVTANDISVDVPTAFDTTAATPSAEAWACTATTGIQDVWYTFTATADYMASATTCDTAAYDTRIEVFDGDCMTLNSIACNDDGPGCSGFTSTADFMAVTGTQYFVRVGGFNAGSFGAGTLLVTGPPPAVMNDNCSGALPLLNGVSEMFDTTMATTSPDAGPSCGGSTASMLDIWYTLTPLADGDITVDTFGSLFDTRIAAYEGACGTLTEVACNDDSGGLQSSITFTGVACTTYTIRVAGFGGGSGTGMVTAVYADAISNDDCIDATAISAGTTAYCNLGATDSLVDMSCVFNGEASDVWFSYTAAASCPVTVDLSGSDYDTGMAIYEGDCMTLTEVDCDDDGGTGLDSLISFDAVAGTTYIIQIGGFNGASGLGVITLSEGLGSMICAGDANSTGVGSVLKVSGSIAVADNAMILTVTDLPMNTMGFFVTSMETNTVANPGGSMGTLCIASFTMGRFAGDILDSGATGSVSLTPDLAAFPVPSGPVEAVMVGETRNFQYWHRDAVGGAATSNFSSAESVTFE